MKKLLLLLLLGYITQVKSQITFQKTYGTTANEQACSLLKTTDGGYIMVGISENKLYVTKTDSDGVMQWSKKYGAPLAAVGQHINTTVDGGYIITGSIADTSAQFNSNKALLLKIKADGTFQWSKYYGKSGEDGQHVQQTADKGYIVIGNTNSFSISQNIYVFKTDSLGTLQWTKVLAGNGCCGPHDFGCSIIQLTDGSYVLLGNIYNRYANNSEIYLAKINAYTNIIQWETSYILIAAYGGTDVASFTQTADKGFIITGDSYPNGAFLFKTDSTGVYQWSKLYSVPFGLSVIQTTDGGFAFVSNNNSSTKNIVLCKTNRTGDLQWAKTVGDTSNGSSSSVQTLLQNSNGDYIIGGSTSFGAGQGDFLLLKTDSLGNNYCNSLAVSITTTTCNAVNDYTPVEDTLGYASVVVFNADTGGIQHILCYNIGGINQFSNNNVTNIYPNPAQNKITIDAKNINEVTLFDILGNEITSANQNQIDVSTFTNGVYFVQVKTNQGLDTKKIIIQH